MWELGERKGEGRQGNQVQHPGGKGYTKGWATKMSALYESLGETQPSPWAGEFRVEGGCWFETLGQGAEVHILHVKAGLASRTSQYPSVPTWQTHFPAQGLGSPSCRGSSLYNPDVFILLSLLLLILLPLPFSLYTRAHALSLTPTPT